MKINNRAKIVAVAAALAATAGIAGTAFTGTGVARTGLATGDQFVGGTINQNVTGATLSDVVYGFADATNTSATSVTLTFADQLADGQNVTIVLNGTDNTWTCPNPIAADTAPATTSSTVCSGTGLSVDSIDVTVHGTHG